MASLTSTISPHKGFHPTSTSTIHLPPPSTLYASCELYLYLSLPPLVFVDTHELAQRAAATHYTFTHWGSRDVERPAQALAREPSEVLVRVEVPKVGEWDEFGGESVLVEVPLHLRYGSPRSTRSSAGGGGGSGDESGPYEEIRIDWPSAFFLCPSTSSVPFFFFPFRLCVKRADAWPRFILASLTSNAPLPSLPAHVFAALPSGHPRTKILVPVPPHPEYTNTTTTLLLPVGDTSDLAFVEPLTVIVILLCFWALLKTSCRTARRIRTVPPGKDD